MRRAIAVDHQPRVALRDQVGVQMFRQRIGEPGDTDVPADVTRKLGFCNPEIAQHARNGPAVMITCQKERRGSRCIVLMNRRNIGFSEQA